MNKVQSAEAAEPSLMTTVSALARHYLGGRRGLMVLSVAVLAAAFFNWGWLVAIGVAPLLVALAPCAAMCALGLCMKGMGGKSCSSPSKTQADPAEKDGK